MLINPHSLDLLRQEKGRGRKLLMKYDGPFEIMHKVSPVAYRLRLPVSYGIHPVLNIAHLELYKTSPAEFGERPKKRMNRADFEDKPEMEVERIIAERWKTSKGGRRIKEYRIRFVGLGPEEDEWKSRQGLRNAPDLLSEWDSLAMNNKEGRVTRDKSDINAKTQMD